MKFKKGESFGREKLAFWPDSVENVLEKPDVQDLPDFALPVQLRREDGMVLVDVADLYPLTQWKGELTNVTQWADAVSLCLERGQCVPLLGETLYVKHTGELCLIVLPYRETAPGSLRELRGTLLPPDEFDSFVAYGEERKEAAKPNTGAWDFFGDGSSAQGSGSSDGMDADFFGMPSDEADAAAGMGFWEMDAEAESSGARYTGEVDFFGQPVIEEAPPAKPAARAPEPEPQPEPKPEPPRPARTSVGNAAEFDFFSASSYEEEAVEPAPQISRAAEPAPSVEAAPSVKPTPPAEAAPSVKPAPSVEAAPSVKPAPSVEAQPAQPAAPVEPQATQTAPSEPEFDFFGGGFGDFFTPEPQPETERSAAAPAETAPASVVEIGAQLAPEVAPASEVELNVADVPEAPLAQTAPEAQQPSFAPAPEEASEVAEAAQEEASDFDSFFGGDPAADFFSMSAEEAPAVPEPAQDGAAPEQAAELAESVAAESAPVGAVAEPEADISAEIAPEADAPEASVAEEGEADEAFDFFGGGAVEDFFSMPAEEAPAAPEQAQVAAEDAAVQEQAAEPAEDVVVQEQVTELVEDAAVEVQVTEPAEDGAAESGPVEVSSEPEEEDFFGLGDFGMFSEEEAAESDAPEEQGEAAVEAESPEAAPTLERDDSNEAESEAGADESALDFDLFFSNDSADVSDEAEAPQVVPVDDAPRPDIPLAEAEPAAPNDRLAPEEPAPQSDVFAEAEPAPHSDVFAEAEPAPQSDGFAEVEPAPQSDGFAEVEPTPESDVFAEAEPAPESDVFAEAASEEVRPAPQAEVDVPQGDAADELGLQKEDSADFALFFENDFEEVAFEPEASDAPEAAAEPEKPAAEPGSQAPAAELPEVPELDEMLERLDIFQDPMPQPLAEEPAPAAEKFAPAAEKSAEGGDVFVPWPEQEVEFELPLPGEEGEKPVGDSQLTGWMDVIFGEEDGEAKPDVPSAAPKEEAPKPAPSKAPEKKSAPVEPPKKKPEGAEKGGRGFLFGKKKKEAAEASQEEQPSKEKPKAKEKPAPKEKAKEKPAPKEKPPKEKPKGKEKPAGKGDSQQESMDGDTQARRAASGELYLSPKKHRTRDAVRVPKGLAVTLGRSRDMARVVLNFSDVSENHALIVFDQGAYYLSDDHSTNGTFVNGKRLAAGETREIEPLDEIAFSKHKYYAVFEAE